MIAFESQLDGESYVALVKGDVEHATEPVLVRMHAHCLAGDVFGGSLCDCQQVLDHSLEMIAREGTGALIYLHQTSKGFNVDEGKRPAFHPEQRASAPAQLGKSKRKLGLRTQHLFYTTSRAE